MIDSRDYVIWSNEHNRWWAAGERGYTHRFVEAGRYTRERALAICALAREGSMPGIPNEIPVLAADVLAFIGPPI